MADDFAGGGTPNDSGTNIASGGGADQVIQPGGSAAGSSGQGPTPLELADDALIRVKGSEKPVKFGEYVKNFQSQWTKASQRASNLEKQLQAEKAARASIEQAQRAAQQQRGGQQGGPDVFQQLRALPYLTGEDAVGVVQSIGEQIKYRDQILLAALQQMKQLQQVVGGLHENHTMSSFDGKINRWLSEGGYPAEAADLAKEIYLAYEGDDLDEDFPRIFNERWNQVEKLVEARRAAKVSAARRTPFVPGRGGAAGPSAPKQLDPRMSSSQLTDALWDSIQTGEGT